MTTRINTAGELELKEEGVDHQHLKQFSAVRGQKMILNNPPDFGPPDFGRKNIPEAAGPFDNEYIEGGISVHSQDPIDWSIADENTDWLAVVTWDDAGQSNQFQIAMARDDTAEVTRIFMRGLATWSTWGPWFELTAIPEIQSDLSDVDMEVNGLSDALDVLEAFVNAEGEDAGKVLISNGDNTAAWGDIPAGGAETLSGLAEYDTADQNNHKLPINGVATKHRSGGNGRGEVTWIAPANGILRNLRVRAQYTFAATREIRVVLLSNATDLRVSIPTNDSGNFTNLVDEVAVTAGQQVTLESQGIGSADHSVDGITWSVEFVRT